MEKINYYKMSLDIINKTDLAKRNILIHACCGPCLAWPLEFLLNNNFNVTVYFNNSNIYPKEEYERRLNELMRFLKEYGENNNKKIELIVKPYDNESYCKTLDPFKEEAEGLSRCRLCYKKRMEDGYKYASEHGFDFFTTVMSISRQKNSQILNAIGKELEEQYKGCNYLYSDFKKNKGIDIGKKMRDDYHMYQQDYCGCKYTFPKSKMYNSK